jgi:hypothetical protein
MKYLDSEQTGPGPENVIGDVYLAIAIAGVDTLVIMGAAIAFVWM